MSRDEFIAQVVRGAVPPSRAAEELGLAGDSRVQFHYAVEMLGRDVVFDGRVYVQRKRPSWRRRCR